MSGEASATTLNALWTELRQTHGRIGSVNLSDTTYNIHGWYNYAYWPHRNGTIQGDNAQYGTIILTPMTTAGDSYICRWSSSSEAPTQVRKIIDSVNINNYSVNYANSAGTSNTATKATTADSATTANSATTASKAKNIIDAGNSNEISAQYSGSAVAPTQWATFWQGYKLVAVDMNSIISVDGTTLKINW